MSTGRIETRMVPPEEWGALKDIAKERGCALPTLPEQAGFLASFDGGALAGVLAVETVFHFPFLWVAPESRGRGTALALARDADALIPEGHSAVVLADRDSVARVMARLGGTDRGTFRLIRKDY